MTADVPAGAVVVGVDRSDSAARAVDWAAQLAAREHRTLAIVHAYNPPTVQYGDVVWLTAEAARWQRGMERLGEITMDDAARRAAAGRPELDIRVVGAANDPRSALAEASQRAHIVVVGTHGRGRVARMVLGSVSEYVARQAACPVVVVRGPEGSGPVVAGIDSDPTAVPTLEFAFHQAAFWGRSLDVVHCDRRSSVGVAGDDDAVAARLLVAEAIAGFGEQYPDVPVSIEVLSSEDPGGALAAAAADAQVLVLGRASRRGVKGFLAPSVLTGVLERSGCAVAIVPGDVERR